MNPQTCAICGTTNTPTKPHRIWTAIEIDSSSYRSSWDTTTTVTDYANLTEHVMSVCTRCETLSTLRWVALAGFAIVSGLLLAEVIGEEDIISRLGLGLCVGGPLYALLLHLWIPAFLAPGEPRKRSMARIFTLFVPSALALALLVFIAIRMAIVAAIGSFPTLNEIGATVGATIFAWLLCVGLLRLIWPVRKAWTLTGALKKLAVARVFSKHARAFTEDEVKNLKRKVR